MGPEYRNTGIPQQKKQPFDAKEKRALSIRAERIDPKHLIDGKPPKVKAEHKRDEKHPTHEARHYELTGIPERVASLRDTGNTEIPKERNGQPVSGPPVIRVQLNHGNPADDAERLIAIAEDFLSLHPTTYDLHPEGGEA